MDAVEQKQNELIDLAMKHMVMDYVAEFKENGVDEERLKDYVDSIDQEAILDYLIAYLGPA